MQKYENVIVRKAVRFSLADSLTLLGASPTASLTVDPITESVQVVDGHVTTHTTKTKVMVLTHVVPPSGATTKLVKDPNGGGLKFVVHHQQVTIYEV